MTQSEQGEIQLRYKVHREARNQQQRAIMLSKDFSAFSMDPILVKLLDQEANPGFVDPRNCLVFWARPPRRIRELVDGIQRELQEVAPSEFRHMFERGCYLTPEGLWLMPVECLHLTVLEVAHSKTENEISSLVEAMESKIPHITEHTLKHRARLVNPMLSYDTAAIALSFLPASGEGSDLNAKAYTYHHLRRDIYAECKNTGVEVASRYVVPSSHLTVARFVTEKDFAKADEAGLDQLKIRRLIEKIEEVNDNLHVNHWTKQTGKWQVGEEKGLVCRTGRVWYGGGQSQHEGSGFL